VPETDLGAVLGAENLRQSPLPLPACGERDVVRHFTGLSQLNFALDTGFYPLGSCTMKYNPLVHEDVAALPGFCDLHPRQDVEDVQGALALMFELDKMLSSLMGMARFTLQPAAGAHGELTGLMIMTAYHRARGDHARKTIIVPDSSHGTNPASAASAGFAVKTIHSGPDGLLDLDALRAAVGPDIAGLMLTNPSTLGLFEVSVLEAAQIVHEAGGLLYYDGANATAILCKTSPAAMGFDIVHLNLHKTFSTPHGGGGPGAGPVGVAAHLTAFLPGPLVECKDGVYYLDNDRPQSIGRMRSFFGNFMVLVRAYAYIRALGAEGLSDVSTAAVANANYLARRLRDAYPLPHDGGVMHEFVLSGEALKARTGVSTLDIAKGIVERGYHPPTIYFPLIVPEAIMIEPTETESPETLCAFADMMLDVLRQAETDPEALHAAPNNKPVRRLDETAAARSPIVRYNTDHR
jgi:glycine dehydrogenase subunit 2